jgi:hypothetical protein
LTVAGGKDVHRVRQYDVRAPPTVKTGPPGWNTVAPATCNSLIQMTSRRGGEIMTNAGKCFAEP